MSARSPEGRHVVLTGASSGIGAALARAFARRGARLTLVARRTDLLDALAAELAVTTHVVTRDLSEVPPPGWLAGAQAALGPVDVLVNNAGMENTGSTLDADPDEGRRLLRLNLETPLAVTAELLPGLVARRGAVINVSSVSGLVAPPQQSWYGASKAGLGAFSESLRGELRATGLTVVTVYPGPVRTPMADRVYARMGGRRGVVRLMPEGDADVLADRVLRALDRRRARVIYPRFYVASRWFPWLARGIADQGARRVTVAVAR